MTDDAFTYQLSTAETPSLAVVYAVAEYTDRSVLQLSPLAACLDPDALDETISTGQSATCTFYYEGCLVEVNQNRIVLQCQE